MRASSSGRRVRQKRRGGRGTGAVKATGSHEESPTDRRHPGSSRALARHGAEVTVVSAAPSRSSPLAKAIGKTGGRRRGDRDARGSITKGAVGRQRPRSARLASLPDDRSHEWLASFWIRRSGLGRRETLGPPVKSRRAQTLRGAHAVKAAEANAGNARGAGARSFVSGGRSRSDASRVLPAGRSKASWRMRKQAGR